VFTHDESICLNTNYILAMRLAGAIFIRRPTIFHGNTGTVED